MKLLDPAHPFFAPLWRRVVIVAVTFAWAVVEALTGGPLWAVLFGAVGVYCAYQLLIAFPGSDKGRDP